MKNYLSLKYQFCLVVVLLVIWLLEISLLIPISLVFIIVFLFRQKNIVFKEKFIGALAPVSGKVRSIIQKDGFVCIEIIMPWWGGMGIHLPFYSELKNKKEKEGEVFWRYGFGGEQVERCGTVLLIEEIATSKKWEITFEKCSLGGMAHIMILPGDRGETGTSIGYFMLGGVVRIRFTAEDYEPLVRRGDSIVAGKTLVCS